MSSENLESQETTSSSLVEVSLNIAFKDISYSVRKKILSRERKTIVNKVSGSFNAGELTVIMGQSGTGKSTLMNILAGYTKPSEGSLQVNGRERNEKAFRRRSCYILQDDRVHDALTIHESLVIAAELKLGHHVNEDQKKQRIEQILSSLRLEEARNTRVGNLSGGQKKRLAIGLELVSDPSAIFLDEPTSGLDISISKNLVLLLHLLARQGRTVVVTMHQPSAALLQMVDKLYAVVGGRCAYSGSVPALLPFLDQLQIKEKCPPYHNPVDFLIEICNDNANELVEQSENGKCEDWAHQILHETDDNFLAHNNLNSDDVNLTMLPVPEEDDQSNKILLKLKSTYSTSVWKQFTILTRRSLLTIYRDPSFTCTVTGIHFLIALVVGCLFYDIGAIADHIMDSYHMLYFSLMFLMFTAFSSVTIRFPQQIPVVRREHFNRWYTTGAYFMSALASTMPTQTFCTLLYAVLVYWLTGMPVEAARITMFFGTLLLTSYVSLSVGFLNGSMCDVKNGVIVGPLFIMPFTIFSGFFLRYSHAPYFARWIFHVSFLKHGLDGLVYAVFGNGREKLPCIGIFCYYKSPHELMKAVEVTITDYSNVAVALIVIGASVTVVSYIILKIRLKNKW